MSTTALPLELARTRRGRRLTAVVGAVLAALAVYALARLVGGHVHQPAFGSADPKGLSAVIVATAAAIGALLGWLLIALLERTTAKAIRIWTIAAPLLLLVSLSAPLSGHGVSAGNRLALIGMHLAVGAVIIPSLRATSPARERR